jgi:succinate dehydrogenase/fumarate reductase-like Fe-S protein
MKKEKYSKSVEERDKLDGKWECIMCFSCTVPLVPVIGGMKISI